MLYTIQISVHAVGDIKIAKEFYNQQKAGLGVAFVNAVKNKLRH